MALPALPRCPWGMTRVRVVRPGPLDAQERPTALQGMRRKRLSGALHPCMRVEEATRYRIDRLHVERLEVVVPRIEAEEAFLLRHGREPHEENGIATILKLQDVTKKALPFQGLVKLFERQALTQVRVQRRLPGCPSRAR